MASYTESNRHLAIITPMGRNALLLEKLSGSEAVSELFQFRLEMLAPAAVKFVKVLNQPATVRITLPNGSNRFINGIIRRLSQGPQVAQGKDTLIRYHAELVPALWRLTRRVRSRIFQNQSVPDILKAVLVGDWHLDVALKLYGTYEPRNYCVQYQETDFAFVSRLMEEEGIAYYFTHTGDEEHENDKHTLVLSDQPAGFEKLPKEMQTVAYEPARGGLSERPRVWEWSTTQEVTAGSYSLSDYHFEVPSNNLDARATVTETLKIGHATHPLRFQHWVGDTEMLEVSEYPAGYAHRFDGIDSNGAEKNGEIEKLHTDTARVARLRAEEAATWSLACEGAGSCLAFLPGYVFTLTGHFDGEDRYLLTRVEHEASVEGSYTSGNQDAKPVYENRFQALPAALPFRPRRRTPKPRIAGPQTAVVQGVQGPQENEIFVDKYGRVKVRFHWDNSSGQTGAYGSCWVRVAQVWAGKTWGAFFWPRVGNEVVVAFEEGDPDRPLIIGSVYNEDNRPPLILPDNAMLGGIKSAIFRGDPAAAYNALIFHDAPDQSYTELFSHKNDLQHIQWNRIEYVPNVVYRINGGT
jgi:type VI secretion system secreted protein VgrG